MCVNEMIKHHGNSVLIELSRKESKSSSYTTSDVTVIFTVIGGYFDSVNILLVSVNNSVPHPKNITVRYN